MILLEGKRNIQIRNSRLSEYKKCAEIYSASWKSAFPDSQRKISITDFLNETRGELLYVAVTQNKILGYISIWKPEWFIHHLYVEPSQQGNGIGKALLEYVEILVGKRPLSLKCQLTNKRAINFYHAARFEECTERGIDEYGEWIRLFKKHE